MRVATTPLWGFLLTACRSSFYVMVVKECIMVISSARQAALHQARVHMDSLFALIRQDSLYERGVPERHRIIFYLGHVEAFDWNQICRWTIGQSSFHPEFDELFEAGIDPQDGMLPQDQPSDWPSVDEVMQYNNRVRDEVDQVFDDVPSHIRHMAIEHRWMHVETTAYILHRLSPGCKVAPPLLFPPESPPPVHQMIEIPAGTATLGRDSQATFGWDNEFEQDETSVPAFSMSKYMVTNGQYLEFVKDGAASPSLWIRRGEMWRLRTMFGECVLPLDWPVYVSQREAQAYATWAGLSLPTEAQFHRAAYGTWIGKEGEYPWGSEPPRAMHGNFGFTRWDPLPVTANPAGDSDFGVAQLLGNGWEWTSTVFSPFEGFTPYPTYPGYSARFFDQDHYVVKGAGPQTATCFLRRSFRNWFRPSYPYAHTGFRCVQN